MKAEDFTKSEMVFPQVNMPILFPQLTFEMKSFRTANGERHCSRTRHVICKSNNSITCSQVRTAESPFKSDSGEAYC